MKIKNIMHRQNVDDHAILEDNNGNLYYWYLGTERIEEAPQHEPTAGLIKYDPVFRELLAKSLRAFGHTVLPDTPQARYDEKNTVQVKLKLNAKTDADILDRLTQVENKQGYIKALIRADMK